MVLRMYHGILKRIGIHDIDLQLAAALLAGSRLGGEDDATVVLIRLDAE